MAKGELYPKDFYVIADDKNGIRFYEEDPFRLEDAEEKDIDFGLKLFTQFGIGDARNPLVIRVLGTVIHRCEEFNSMTLMKIRRNNLPMHVEDAEGNLVNVLPEAGASEFPVTGELVSPAGDILTRRRYANTGECEDGLRSHRLVFVKNESAAEEISGQKSAAARKPGRRTK